MQLLSWWCLWQSLSLKCSHLWWASGGGVDLHWLQSRLSWLKLLTYTFEASVKDRWPNSHSCGLMHLCATMNLLQNNLGASEGSVCIPEHSSALLWQARPWLFFGHRLSLKCGQCVLVRGSLILASCSRYLSLLAVSSLQARQSCLNCLRCFAYFAFFCNHQKHCYKFR